MDSGVQKLFIVIGCMLIGYVIVLLAQGNTGVSDNIIKLLMLGILAIFGGKAAE